MELEVLKKEYSKNHECIYELKDDDFDDINICNYLIEQNAQNINVIPDRILKNNIDLCYKAINKTWQSIKYIKEDVLLSDLYFDEKRKLERSRLAELAIEMCYFSITYLPISFLNRCDYLYFLALKKDLLTLRYMPSNIQIKYKENILNEIFNKKKYYYLKDVDASIKTQEVYEKIFNDDIHNIEYIPKEFRTKEMQEIVNQDIKNTNDKIERIDDTITTLQERIDKINQEINRLKKEKTLIKKW